MTSNSLPAIPAMNALPAPAVHSASISRFAPVDPVRLLRRHVLLLSVLAVASVLVGTGVWYVLRQYMPEYSTESQLAITGAVGAFDTAQSVGDVSSNQLEQIAAFIKNQSIRITSDVVLNEMLGDPDVRTTTWFKSFGSDEATRTVRAKERLQSLYNPDLDASQIRGSTLMRVTLKNRSPEDLQKVLDILVNVYIRRLHSDNENQSIDLRHVFTDEKTRAENDIQTIDKHLIEFQRSNDLTSIRESLNERQIAYQLLADQAARLNIALGAAADAADTLQKNSGDAGATAYTPEMIYTVEHEQAVFTMSEQIRSLHEQQAVLRERDGPTHRTFLDNQRLIDQLENDRAAEIKRQLRSLAQARIEKATQERDGLAGQLASIQPKLKLARDEMKDLSVKIQEYERIAEDRKSAMEQRNKAGELIDQIRIKDIRKDTTRVYPQQAAIPPKMTFPKPYYVIPFVAVLVLGVGFVLVFLNEVVDQRIKGPEEVKMVPNTELLGVVPDVGEDPSEPIRIDNIVRLDPAGLMAEVFRQGRTAILSRMDRRGYKTLLVSCAQPQSGVSTVVNNLALSIALNGRKVLVLDANFRRPDQHRLFEVPVSPGLVEVLRGQTTLDDAIAHKEDPAVDVLATGDTKDAAPELLESPQFRALLTQLEARYDLILIDAPPVLLASDCQVLAKQTDAILLVVRAMADTRGMMGRMLRTLAGYRAEPIGVVLNNARASAGGYFRANYQQFHAYQRKHGARTPGTGRRPAATVVKD